MMGRCIPPAGSASRIRRAALEPDAAARAERPYGSDIANGMLYVADRDGGTTPTEPSVAVIRRFNLKTGAPAGETRVEKSAWLNDIEVADDGTMYATQTGVGGQTPDPTSWQVWKITRDGAVSMFLQGRRSASRTASRSTRRATSWSLTSATARC